MALTEKHHMVQVLTTIEGRSGNDRQKAISSSWQRCSDRHGLDPESEDPPHIVTGQELRLLREPHERLILHAQEELDELFKVARQANYVVLLSDSQGVAIDHRGCDTQARRFRHWGTWLGGVWSEDVEGTNAIGTALVERRPVTVHRGQHYRTRHADLSCSAAPIFGIDSELLGVLDVSCIDPKQSEHAHALTGAMTAAAAQAIEERLFRDRFRADWVIAVGNPYDGGSKLLLAVDRDQRIVGADRNARLVLPECDRLVETAISLWSIFTRDGATKLPISGGDLPALLLRAGNDIRWPALITPPAVRWANWQSDSMHLRPRLCLLGRKEQMTPAQARGGLSPALIRRVHDYVEVHLDENVDLDALAAIAGLSRYHFARSFKQSEGMTPHAFLLNRRLEKAEDLLLRSKLSLSEIALAVGFADQSHLARRFRQWSGVSPSEFRKRAD